jgi:hypothetical protein
MIRGAGPEFRWKAQRCGTTEELVSDGATGRVFRSNGANARGKIAGTLRCFDRVGFGGGDGRMAVHTLAQTA